MSVQICWDGTKMEFSKWFMYPKLHRRQLQFPVEEIHYSICATL